MTTSASSDTACYLWLTDSRGNGTSSLDAIYHGVFRRADSASSTEATIVAYCDGQARSVTVHSPTVSPLGRTTDAVAAR